MSNSLLLVFIHMLTLVDGEDRVTFSAIVYL